MKFVDVATFDFPNDSVILESILSAENTQYLLDRNSNSYVFTGSGGTLSVAEEDKERAVKTIKEAGFERFLIS